MKYVLTAIILALLGGCSSSPSFNEDKHEFKQRLSEAQMEIGRIQAIGFCGDDPRLKSYVETERLWSFTCYDGRSFMFHKKQ